MARPNPYSAILKEGLIGPVKTPNRVVFPAIQMNYANTDGTVSDKLLDYYSQLAEGGCGLIITGTAVVSSECVAFDRVLRIDNDRCVPGLAQLFSAIREKGGVPGIQMIHYGRQASSSATGNPLLAPSAIACPLMSQFDKGYRVVAMSPADIERVKNDFIEAGRRAISAGAQVIEIHAAHGYLLNEFLSPYSNKRTDEYGGSPDNRLRLVREIVEGVRAAAAGLCAISVRVSAHEHVEGGLTPADFKDMIPLLEEAGMDFLNVSAGVYGSLDRIVPPRSLGETPHRELAKQLKSYSRRPVCAVGSVFSLEKAEEIIASGDADFVAIGRAQIADPELVKKTINGDGEKINKCMACNRCTFWSTGDPHMFCSVNPFFSPLRNNQANMEAELFETISAIDIVSPPKKYIREILRALCMSLGFDYGSVVRVTGPNESVMVSAYELPDNYLEQARKIAPLHSSPLQEAMATRKIVVLENALDDPRMAPWRSLLEPRGVKTMIWVPLLSGPRAFGTYVLYSTHIQDISNKQFEILRHMAQLISIAIISNQYLDDLNNKKQELQKAYDKLQSMQSRLIQSEKMSAVGQLAAGVAHEINNPLGVILGFAQSLCSRIKPGDALELPLRSIERETVRCKNLVRDLLSFSRTDKGDRVPVDINKIVEGAMSLISANGRLSSIEIKTELTPNLGRTLGNSNQIQQVFVNLCTNAVDAMPKGGVLTIKTEGIKDLPLSWACLKVSDTGNGIPPELHPKIFEPFFTTKPVGTGTGLGLSLIYEIVKKHSGIIEFQSRPGYTEFCVKFPVGN